MMREELEKLESSVRVIISGDKNEAFLLILEDIFTFSVSDVVEILNRHDVIYGIDLTRIAVLLNEKELNTKVLVAKGIPAINGSDGYYKYFFNTEPVTNTIILEDGTVDYNTLGKLELCKENDLLVEYHPAIQGCTGVSINGAVIQPNPVKDLKPLKGKGFNVNETDNCYYSNFDGKIESNGASLKISQIYVVEGDLDANSKPIKFYGDVYVQGHVYADAKIEASGNITVNGCVESATLIAGKSVLLKNGMQGSQKGYIFAKENVTAKFFEQTTVVAKGNVVTNSIMNCDIMAFKKIIVSGKRGTIIGGNCRAIELITASVIGNTAEMHTHLVIGMGKEFYDNITEIDKSLSKLKIEIDSLEKQLNCITEKMRINKNVYLINVRNSVIKEKVKKVAEFNEQTKLKEDLLNQKERSIDGSVCILGRVFPNTHVCINGVTNILREIYRNVTLKTKESEIKVYTNFH